MTQKHIFGFLFAAAMLSSNFAGVPVYAAGTENYSDAGEVKITQGDNTLLQNDTTATLNNRFGMQIKDVEFDGEDLTLTLPNIDVQENNVTVDNSKVNVDTTDNDGMVSEMTIKNPDRLTGKHIINFTFGIKQDTTFTVDTQEDTSAKDSSTTTSSDDSSTSSSSDSEATVDDSSSDATTTDSESTDGESTTSDAAKDTGSTSSSSTESTEPKETKKDVKVTVDSSDAQVVEGKIDTSKLSAEEKEKIATVKVDLLNGAQPTGDAYVAKVSDGKYTFGKQGTGIYDVKVESVQDANGQEVTDVPYEVKGMDIIFNTTKKEEKPNTNTETNKGSEDNNGTKTEENKGTTTEPKNENSNNGNGSGNNNGNTTVVDNSKTDVTLTHNDINVNIYAHQDNNTLVINQATDKDAEVLSTNDDQTVDVNGKIIWKDNSNAAKKRPSNVVVVLFANDKQYRALTVTGSGDEWDFTFKGLPKNDENGNAYKYAIKEKALENYRGDVNGYVLTNTYLGNNAAQTTSGTDTGTQTNTGLYFGIAGVAVVVIVVLVVLSKRKKA